MTRTSCQTHHKLKVLQRLTLDLNLTCTKENHEVVFRYLLHDANTCLYNYYKNYEVHESLCAIDVWSHSKWHRKCSRWRKIQKKGHMWNHRPPRIMNCILLPQMQLNYYYKLYLISIGFIKIIKMTSIKPIIIYSLRRRRRRWRHGMLRIPHK